MSKYFIKHVQTYRTFTSSPKGREVENLVGALQHAILDDQSAVQQLYESLAITVHKINLRYPRYKRWVVAMTGYSHIVVRPEASRSAFGDDYIASITIVPVTSKYNRDEIHQYFKRHTIKD